MLNRSTLQQFLRDRIPLTTAMAIDVVAAEQDGVTLGAPLEPNINHRDTVFGGSAAAVAILSAWGLIFVRLRDEHPNATIVIQRHTMRHLRPITSAFTASSFLPDADAWEKFVTSYKRKKLARISVRAALHCGGELVGELDAAFVALELGVT
ncbi:MAG: YiiD C-terminal domain-containing protein [Vicinamibacterales bacterium]